MNDKITNSTNIEELIKNQEICLGVVNSSEAIVFAIDKDLKYLIVNNVFAQNLGKSPQDIIGKSIFEIFPEIATEKLAKNIKEIFDTNKSIFLEEKIEIKGQDTYNDSYLNPIRNEKGEVIAVSGIVRDVTIKKKEDEELKKTKDDIIIAAEKFKTYMDIAPIGILVIDDMGNYTYANKMASTMSGYSNEEILKQSIKDSLPPEYLEKGFKLFNEVKITGYISSDVMIKRKNGEIIWINLVASLIDNGKNILTFYEDITKRIDAEKKIKVKIDELEKFYKITIGRELEMVELKRKIKELETKLADKDVTQKD